MTTQLAAVIDTFADQHIVVLGDALLDAYLCGAASRLSREAPVPVVRINERVEAPGGAANTALNVRRLGARVNLISAIGDDANGARLCALLEQHDVDATGLIRDPSRTTPTLQRVLAASHLLVRFDEGTFDAVGTDVERAIVERLHRSWPHADAIIVSDYNCGVVSEQVVEALAVLQSRAPRVLVVDSKVPAAFRRVRPTAVKPNWTEVVELLAGSVTAADRATGIWQSGEDILSMTGAQIAAVTLDAEGAILFERDRAPYRTYACPRPNRSANGAGDTFVATLAASLAAGAHTPAVAELASAAAAVVVEKDRTATCSREELRARVLGDEKVVRDLAQLAECIARHRERNHRIVFTNGCFDLLHRGHITHLNRAKTLGDVLVVGVNDDDSVRRLKGPQRPITPLDDRLRVLAELSCIDHIVPFGGDTAIELVDAIHPDVFVKGGDRTIDGLPEAAAVAATGGRVQILPYEEDQSTTGIIERIRRVTASSGIAVGL